MRRDDLVTIFTQGDFGKPAPAVVMQADPFNEHNNVTVLPVTSTPVAAPLLRIALKCGVGSGRQKPSQVMADKAMTVERDNVGPVIGRIGTETLVEVERCLAVFLGIAK